jgi:hypothetical protein
MDDRRSFSWLAMRLVTTVAAFNLILLGLLTPLQVESDVSAGSATPEPDQTPGGRWSRWPEQPTDLDLRDVYFHSRDEGWAVGGKDVQGHGGDIAIVLQYSEGHWSVVEDLPVEARSNVQFNAVDGTGPGNLWIAGQDHLRGALNQEVGVLFHYDGTTWQKVELPGLPSVAPLTDTDVVATEAGYELWTISLANGNNTSYILHFNGTSWNDETLQNRSLLGIHMLGIDEGQIVTQGAGGAPDGHHYWYHDGVWQGTSVWTPQPLNAVSMAEPTYGWAVGNNGATDEYVGQCHNPETDCSWYARQALRSHEGRAITPDLYDVKMVSRAEGWVVGQAWNGRSTVAYLTQEPNRKWRVVSVEDDPGKTLLGLAMLAGPDGRAIEGWAVGEDGTILHYTVPTPAGTSAPTATATPTATVTLTPSPGPAETETLTPPATPSATVTITPTPSPTFLPPRWPIFLPMILRQNRLDGRLSS